MLVPSPISANTNGRTANVAGVICIVRAPVRYAVLRLLGATPKRDGFNVLAHIATSFADVWLPRKLAVGVREAGRQLEILMMEWAIRELVIKGSVMRCPGANGAVEHERWRSSVERDGDGDGDGNAEKEDEAEAEGEAGEEGRPEEHRIGLWAQAELP